MLVPPTLLLMWEVCEIFIVLKSLILSSQFKFSNFQFDFFYFATQAAGEHLGLDTPVDEPEAGI